MSGISRQVQEWVDWLKARPAGQHFEAAIPPNRVIDDDGAAAVDGRAFEPEASYCSVRIVEMHLKNGAEYFRQFLPMAVTVAQFIQGEQERTLPFFLNNQKLREALGAAGPGLGLVQMKNVYALRHLPANANGLSLFSGLFRTVHEDFAAALLDLLAEVGNKLGGAAVGQAADVAKTLYSRLSGIVGLRAVELRFGNLDGNALSGGSGYRVFAGPADRPLKADDLAMVQGRLHRMVDGHPERITDCDYCVIAIERLESRAADGQLTSLPLHKYWTEAARHLAQKHGDEADATFDKLQAEVLLTPDLTEADRLVALALYQKKWAQIRDALSAGASHRSADGRQPFRSGLIREVDRRGNGDLARVAGIVAEEIRNAGPAAAADDISSDEARRLAAAFRGTPFSAALNRDVANLFTAARYRGARSANARAL
jgi:hypothetical protein